MNRERSQITGALEESSIIKGGKLVEFNMYSDLFFTVFMASLVWSIYLITAGSRPGLFNSSNRANASDVNRYNVQKVYIETDDNDNEPNKRESSEMTLVKISLFSTLLFCVLFVIAEFVLKK